MVGEWRSNKESANSVIVYTRQRFKNDLSVLKTGRLSNVHATRYFVRCKKFIGLRPNKSSKLEIHSSFDAEQKFNLTNSDHPFFALAQTRANSICDPYEVYQIEVHKGI